MEVARKVKYGTGAPLLNAGVKLQMDYIQQLKRMDIKAIYVHDTLIPDIVIEDVIIEETRERAVTLVRKSLMGLKNNGQFDGASLLVLKKELSGVLDDIISQLLDNNNLTVNLSDIRFTDDYTFTHSVNVGILAMMTAISCGYNKTVLKHIGLGAFLHDLGKVIVPLSILNKHGRLSEKEMEEIKKHPVYGVKLLKSRHLFDSAPMSIILNHHERINGTGYPEGLKEKEIDLYSKVCAITDVYDALVSDRPYRPGFKPHRAIEIMEMECEGFDNRFLQSFLHHIPAYPIGTIVGLSNGYVGTVVSNYYGDSKRPTVRLLCTRDSFSPVTSEEIDLTERLNVVVDYVYQDGEIPEDLFLGRTKG